jgi:potassium-transporting ATPase potassium-binding subunit
MNVIEIVQVIIPIGLIILLAKPLGGYMARIYEGDPPRIARILLPAERLLYRLGGTRPEEETGWKRYAIAMLLVNAIGLFAVYLFQRLQHVLPLNPERLPAVAPGLAFNTAISFATNTNWQSYGGETTMSYLTQSLALTVQNFLSAASGMAVLVAFIRGFSRRTTDAIGNFWVDFVRSVLYILLPLSLVLAVILISQGVVQTYTPYRAMTTLDGGLPQVLAVGPAAGQVAIKQLGTNGGGFFNVNSAHPFENPTPLTNLLELVSILLISGAFCYTFGKMIGDVRQGRALFAAMLILFVGFLAIAVVAETGGNPILTRAGCDQAQGPLQSGGNMEGKEVRFGAAQSALWATATTAASNGSVNAMHDSFTPIGGLAPMVLMQLGEVVFGGVGSGLYGMIAFVLIAVFVAGLMIGRTPEYLGKKIDATEVKMASLLILIPPLLVLGGAAVAVAAKAGRAGVSNPGPHAFSQILYAFSSTGNNNGSAFGGLSVSTVFYDVLLGLAMFFGRYALAIPALAIAGSLARKKIIPASAGTLPTTGPLFVLLVVGVVLIVGALTFLPALALGPIAEALQLKG